MSTNDITQRNYKRLVTAYDRFNGRLFGDTLPPCLITFQRSLKARGHYWPGVVKARRGKRRTAEIALNPAAFPDRSDRDIASTLVHEMVHHWQFHFGTPGRGKYHNKQWAAKMDEVGLRPSSTGRRGGRRTGDQMTHYVIRGGRFEAVWGELFNGGFRLEWETEIRREPDRSKRKYRCGGCGLTVWGKPSLDGLLRCVACNLTLTESGRTRRDPPA